MGSIICRVRDFFIHCIENLQQSPQIFICLVLLNLPYVMQHAFELQGAAGISAVEYMRSILSAFLRTVFFAFFLDLLLKSIPFARLRHFIQAIVLSVSGILFLLDTFTFISYHCVVDGGMLIALLATNPREASEFLAMYVLQERYVLGAAAILVLLTIFHYALLRFIRHKVLLIILLLISFACSLKFVLYLSHYSSLARYGTMFTEIMKEKREYDLMNARIATQEIVLTKNESSIPYVVFVLGESTSRNHMALYGYRLLTTPLLNARAAAGGWYVFQDVISHHAQTPTVLEELFTFYRHQSPGRWFDYNNVFDIVKTAGYHTAWLSNQESFGVWGNVATHYADCCDYKKYVMARSANDKISKYDEELLPLLDTWLHETSGKNFCVIHLLGAHAEYEYRYPESFHIFSEVDEPGESSKEKRTRAEYDNAVRYNDFIVDEIIHRFEDENAILIYVSDHAENVYDDRILPPGHEDTTANRYMVEIPMIIWMSPSFRKAYPDLERRIAESTERPFMTDDMIHVLLDIMGIETKDYDPTKSVINEHFDASRVRIYGKNKDYEKERKEANAK